ncbi:MAG: Rne/Rng family ribonuclease [Leptolyngbyaceae cyanobacterium T60_A2020_046]|nr:Rne/Rng family ribonuclease [Leptolyngbyaceae cyanobacterium T60_A2020_046]
MPKQIVIAEQHRIAAVFAEDQIQELIVATGNHQVGDIYLGTVENVLPGIDAAFINLGDSDRNGFMHVSDLGPLRLKRTAGSITELVAPQQKVLVQIMKEPTGNKGPRLTGNVTLPGRYLVLMPYGRGVNLSRRIRNEQERNRLRALAILVKPAGMGLLVRTEAEGVAEEAIIEDLEALQRQWENVQQEALSTRPPALLNRDDDFIQRVLRDVYSADVNRIVTDSHTGLKRVKQHLTTWNGGRMPQGVLVDHHRDRVPLLDFFRVNAAIREALQPRVDLPSGGYIIIEPTEALTVIDVNSGSFTRSATARETVLWTNCEAATEIARQLRLRNVAGVIIVDFIDMDLRRDQIQVLENFNKALRADKARPQISQLSELGLVELTRKRQGQNLYELFGRPCSTCGGLGHVVHLPGEHPGEFSTPDVGREVVAGGGRMSHPSLREGRGEDLEPHADLQELDLLNHPSYQERGSKGGNRRRRRRETTAPVRGAGRPEGVRANGSSAAVEAKAAPVPDATPASTVTPTVPTRSVRSRGGRGDRKPATPPKVVAVEMTPDEQRIYAMMGISPLVLSPEPVEDTKNTVVMVVLPGEAPPTPEAIAPVEAEHLTDASENGGDRDDEPPAEAPRTRIPMPVRADRESPSSLPEAEAASEAIAVAEALEPGISESADTAEEDTTEGNAPRRRRRRRSSASSEGDNISSAS